MSRLRPLVLVALVLAAAVTALNVALLGLSASPIGWPARVVSGNGYLESNRERVLRAQEEYLQGKVSRRQHLAAVIGISNVREAVNLDLLRDVTAARLRLIGLGGSGLGIADVARHADLLLDSELRPDLVVLGVGVHQLLDRAAPAAVVNVGLAEYLRRGDLRNAAIIVRDWWWFYNRRQDVSVAVDAALLDVRARVFRLFEVRLPDAEHRSPWRDMIKSDWPDHFSEATLAEEVRFFDALGAFNLDAYRESPRAVAKLGELTQAFRRRGAEVVIVLMPIHSALRRQIPGGAADIVLTRLGEHCGDRPPVVLDLQNSIDDSGFVDLVHLNRSGRTTFTGVLGDLLRQRVPKRAPLMQMRHAAFR